MIIGRLSNKIECWRVRKMKKSEDAKVVTKCKIYKGVMCWLMSDNMWIVEGTDGRGHKTFTECKRLIDGRES